MPQHGRRTLLKTLGAGAASTMGAATLLDAASATNESVTGQETPVEFRIDRMILGHYEADGDFEEKQLFEFSTDPRTGFDVKFELTGVEPNSVGDVRLGYSAILSDSITGRLQMKCDTMVEENATGGSIELVWHGTPAGTVRLFSTGNWMKNTHFVHGTVANVGAGGATASRGTIIHPA